MTTAAATAASDDRQWRSRPVLGAALRTALLAVPLVTSTGAVYAVSRWLPSEDARSWWGLAALLAVAVAVALVVERGARRLLPIALLLKLSTIFPDRAPSRLRLARAAMTRTPTEQLLWHGTQVRPVSTSGLVLHLVAALGSHDRRTRGHSERVRLLTDMLAAELKLDQDARDRLRWSALLHDLGKMQVAPSVLNKPGRLDPHELATMHQHPAAGAELARPLMPWLGEWGEGILDHHERFDGGGYPAGKAGDQISLAGRLIGLVDAFETMTATRPYKKAVAARTARAELARCAGSHFDPVLVRAFLAISLPRVLWAMGPASFLLALPFLRPVAYVGARGSAAAPQAATTLANGAAGAAAGAALVTGGLAGPLLPADPPERSPSAAAQPLLQEPVATPPGQVGIAGGSSAAGSEVPDAATIVPDGRPQPIALDPVAEPVDEPLAGTSGEPTPSDEPPLPRGPAGADPLPHHTAGRPGAQPESEHPLDAPPPGPPGVDRPDAPPPVVELPAATPGQQIPLGPGVILSGPPVTTSTREATFELADLPGRQWECQVLRNGGGTSSAWQPCSGTWTLTLLKDGDHQVRVRDAATREPTGSWAWTVTSPAGVRKGSGVSP
jgi:putative nucleotidyltransferase with HDIG domain